MGGEVLIAPSEVAEKADPNARRFPVNAFRFVGNAVFSEQELQAIVAGHAGKALNLFDLQKIAHQITEHYRKHGHALSRAVIPAQKIESGVVRIEVVEGKVGKISVEGNRGYPTEFLAARLRSIADEKAVTVRTLERSLLLLNDMPGLTARAVLQPGAQFGTSDLVVQVEEKPVAGSLTLNNHGRDEVGRNRLDGTVEFNNPFSLGDQLAFRGMYAEDGLLQYARIAYSLPVGNNGTRIGINHSEVDYDVRGRFSVLGIEGEAANTEVVMSHPYVRSRTYNLLLGAGLRENRSVQRALGVTLSDNKIALLSLSALANRIHDNASVTNASVILSTNFRSNPNGTRQDAQAAKLDVDVSHLRPVADAWDMFLRGSAAFSADTLADTEKFSIGGPDSVRGYAAAEVRGDEGVQGTAELRRRFVAGDMLGVISLFADSGWVKRKTPGTASPTDALGAYGVGLTLFPAKQFRAKLEYARRAGGHAASDGRNDGRWWLNFTGTF
ncbi:MAG: ShlB/FhaC/HecB family hemolysin secretion/activation protein [Rhodocyclaceae bacterium]|nr:ShlB/FhaC/HecB family hemolysin secretion/activation protein [Rhodocyclaceae bacterium]